MGAASGLVIGRAIIADTCSKHVSAKVYAVVYPLVSLSPALAPAIGGHLAAAFGWHADFLFVAAFAAVAFALVCAVLPETHPRASRSRVSPLEGFGAVLRDGAFRRYTVVVCCIYGAWFVYLTQSPFLFARLGLGEAHRGWMYLPLTGGIIVANLLARRWLDRWPYDRIVTIGVVSFLLGGSAFLVVAALGVTTIPAVVLPMCLVSLANGSALSLAVSGAIAAPHGRAASASGLVGFCQIGSAALLASGVSAVFGTSLTVVAISVSALGLLALGACLSGPRAAAFATRA